MINPAKEAANATTLLQICHDMGQTRVSWELSNCHYLNTIT